MKSVSGRTVQVSPSRAGAHLPLEISEESHVKKEAYYQWVDINHLANSRSFIGHYVEIHKPRWMGMYESKHTSVCR